MYMNDFVIAGHSLEEINKVKSHLHTNFKIKDLGVLRYFLGLEVAKSDKGIVLNQRKYALALLLNVGLGAAKPITTPMEQNIHLTCDVQTKKENNSESSKKNKKQRPNYFLHNPTSYRQLVGGLLYLIMTRPDICFPVRALSQFMQKPKRSHMDEALRVVKYLKGNPGLGILLSSTNDMELTAFCDSDWGMCSDSRRSVTGYIVKVGDSPVP